MFIKYDGDVFVIKCMYHENALLEPLDKRWSKAYKHWRVYDARLNRQHLQHLRKVEGDTIFAPEALYYLATCQETEIVPLRSIKLDDRLLPYQQEAVKKMLTLRYGFLNLPVGSGKTFIAISILRSLYERGEVDKIYILAMVSLKGNWEQELLKWWPNYPKEGILIQGIESLSQGRAHEVAAKFINSTACVILDECSNIKNADAKRSQRAVKLASVCKYRYAMSGLPISQGIHDLYNQYTFLHPDIIGIATFVGFRSRYCILGGYEGRAIIGYRKQEELMDCLAPYTYKISLEECMPFLPKSTYTEVPVSLTKKQQKEIRELKDTLIYEGDPVENVLTLMLRINQIAGKTDGGKMKALIDLTEDMPSFVIFCMYVDEIKAIADKFNCPAIYGDVPTVKRHQIITDFQSGRHRCLVLQYATGSTGINLDYTNYTIFYSHTFNYSHRHQACGRIARLTQTKPMFYYDLKAKGSIDYHVLRALSQKKDVSDYVQEELDKRGKITL